jgi:hypothetical protein
VGSEVLGDSSATSISEVIRGANRYIASRIGPDKSRYRQLAFCDSQLTITPFYKRGCQEKHFGGDWRLGPLWNRRR